MIEITNLNKKYGDNIIFENFNLSIESNVLAILSGESGRGKTTLLNMIGAIEKIDSGEIIVDGIDIMDKKKQLNYLKYKVGFLFQNFGLIENKTVKKNLEIVKKNIRSNYTINEVLDIVGLKNKLNSKIYTLSGGEQQRIALARLLLKKCDLVLADEPTGSLDKKNSDIVIDLIKQLKDMGKTIVIVTHDEYIKAKGEVIIDL
jgi:putative ABC transport system ATP-binding protein